MHKLIKVNEKKLLIKYNKRLFLFNLPAISIVLTLLMMTFLPLGERPPMYYRFTFAMLNAACAYSFFVTLAGFYIINSRIRAHRKDTYIEIFRSDMIVSRSMGAIFGKSEGFRKLWVINLEDIEEASCCKGIITLTGKARLITGRGEWLGYSCDDTDGLRFDNWWYDDNGGENVTSVEIGNLFTNPERVAERITLMSERVKERKKRFLSYRSRMLELSEKSKNMRRSRR